MYVCAINREQKEHEQQQQKKYIQKQVAAPSGWMPIKIR